MTSGCTILDSPTIASSRSKALYNIFFNAKKAGATFIRIIGVEHDNHVAIHIIDNGNGMTQDQINLLGLPSENEHGEGNRIIQKCTIQEGGSIRWSSPGIGAGTCVTIRLRKHKVKHDVSK